MAKHTYKILSVEDAEEFACLEDDIRDFDDAWLIDDGDPVGEAYPEGATAKLKGGSRLLDFVDNVHQWLLVSEKVLRILRDEPIKLEILPLKLLDKKGRPVPGKYAIAHVLGTVDCLDLKKSEYTEDPMEDGKMMAFDRVVLDPKRIPRRATLFRLKSMPELMIVRSDLVEKFGAAGVTGMRLLDLDSPVFL